MINLPNTEGASLHGLDTSVCQLLLPIAKHRQVHSGHFASPHRHNVGMMYKSNYQKPSFAGA